MASSQILPGDEEQSSADFDDLQYSLQVEQENTQKRTFTSWINSQLEKHSPPSFVSDLYTDFGEGHVLLDLLEVLSGQQLPREKGSNTFQRRSNIENALTFLKNRSIKLINIHVADIIEGKPSIVLGLIWTIILHFHIEELARTLACGYNHPSPDGLSAADSSPTASPPPKRNAKAKERWKMSAKKALLLWAKEQCATHGSISVADFKSSWRNGLAFLAIIHALKPDLVDVERAKERSNKENLEEAFEIAETELNIPRLLEPDDVDVVSPDEKSIMTYVAQFLQYFRSLPAAEDEVQGKVNQTLSWLNTQEKKFARLLSEAETMPFYQKFQTPFRIMWPAGLNRFLRNGTLAETRAHINMDYLPAKAEMLSFMESFNVEKKAFQSFLTSKRKASEPSGDYLKMKDAWDSLTSQMNEWKAKLDSLLPPPLDAIESWLQEVERQLADDLPDSQDSEAMAALEGKMRSTQSLMDHFEQHLEALQTFENRDETDMPLVPLQKLEDMRRRFSSVLLADFSNLVEYHQLFCSATLKELVSKLNIWHIKHGTKESVESLLSDWNGFIEEKGFLGQLETTFRVCKEKQNKIMATSNLGVDPEDASKLFKTVESQVSRCNDYIDNVNATLRKILSSWDTYLENISLLQAWLGDTRKEQPPNVPTEVLAAWNSRHGSVNEAGNFLIESCNEEVGSAVSSELKKLNRKWAKLIKKTQFEMRLLGMQEEEVKLAAGSNGRMDSLTAAEPDAVDSSEEILDASSLSPDESLSEEELKLNFEDAHKELEASILKAMQLLGQKTSSEEPVSEHEEAFSILDTNTLRKFLRAAEQLKDILPAHEKEAVEEKSKDVRERWEAVRGEIVSYVELKMEIERGKLNNAFSKLNKQINKEKKLLSAGKTKGLIAEHEAIFSQQGVLGELHTSLQALKTMSKNMTEEEKQAEKKTPVIEYERKKEELQRHVSAVHSKLLSMAAEKGKFAPASANGEKTSFLNPGNGFSTEKDPGDLELEKKLQSAEKFGEHGDLSPKELQKSYHTEIHSLKLCLKTIREKTASAFTGGVKDIFSLQNKLQELEALESEGNSSCKLLERLALLLGKFSGKADESREELLGEWNRAHNALKERTHSLRAVLALLEPVESEWVQLCSADEELRQRDIPRSVLTNTSLPFKKVKKIQTSVANCLKQCSLLEQGRRQRTEIDPKDWEEASAVAGEYKVRLGELGCKMQVIETILRDTETFLALLMHVKQSLGASGPLSLAPGSPMEATQQEFSLIKREAKSLDERLKQVNIDLNDDESGKKMCCEDLVAALLVNESPAVGSVEEEQDTSQDREAQEEFVSKNSDLFKNIQDVHVKISKIGLREPTIPAVQQRLKSISELKQKLDRLAAEMRSLNEVASRLSRSANAQGEEVKRQWKLTEGLWKKTKLAIAEKQEHCTRVMELLKQYHSCRNCLTGIIQKQEHTLSQQVSYMGKENLQRIIAMVNVVKQEFNNHSEDIDRINQIGKSLQSQLNKMKSLEDPPFENEANAIVDRWLDVNEWTENYCKNLERALALWDKLLNLSSSIEEWLNAKLKNLDDGRLTEKELAELEAGLKSQQKNLEEFDAKVDEIQFLLNGYETPLELQVIKSSLLNKMELIIKHLPNQSVPTELNGNTAELKEDLDLAKTQIGMTELLLRSLSPSNTLGIFAKLEEIHQKILQQKHHVKLLEKETSGLNPEVVELNKQLKSVTDLFNSKMQMFQDHFMTLLNYHCQDFCDWFSSTRINLKECFDPSETKEILEEKIQRLTTFLTFEGKGSAFQEVKTLLSQVETYFPEVDISHMSRWMKDQEGELQSTITKCQRREKELHVTLQQFARLEYLFHSSEEWLSLQEKKWQENQEEKPRLGHFYQTLLKKRESFDSLAWLANSLRDSGLTKEEVVLLSPQLVDRYKVLLTCVCKSLDVSQVLSAEENNFEELAQNMIRWVQRLKDTILGLSAKESKAPLEESLQKRKEILWLKEEGDAKLQNIVCLGEHVKSNNGSKSLAVERMISDVQNQWENTIQMARGYLRNQDVLELQGGPDKERKEEARVASHELEKQKQEMPSQLLYHIVLLQEAESLAFLLNELARQHSSLETEESLVALQHLSAKLLIQLEKTAKLLEGHAEEHQHCKQLTMHLRAALKKLLEHKDTEQNQVRQSSLCQAEDALRGIIALVDSVRQRISRPTQACVKDEKAEPKTKRKKKAKFGSVEEREAGNTQTMVQTQEGVDAKADAEELLISFDAPDTSLMEVLGGSQKVGSEESFRVINQTERVAPQLFQEWLTNYEQLSSPVPADAREESALVVKGLKGSLIEAHNFPSSTGKSGKPLPKSGRMPPGDNLLNELQQQSLGYQKELPAAPPIALPLMNGKVMGTDPAPSPIINPSQGSKGSGMEMVSQGGHLLEDQATADYAEMVQKVKKVKISAAELDIVLMNDQLREIENLCTLLERQSSARKQGAKTYSLWEGEGLTTAEGNGSGVPDSDSMVASSWDRLLQDVTSAKKAKQAQLHLLNNYQACLAAVQSSMKQFSEEKENLKTVPPSEDTVLLQNIQKCLDSLQNGRILLQKLKAEQGNLSKHLTRMDEALAQSQVAQIDQWWKQMEDTLKRKQVRVVAQASEFKAFMDKVQELQMLLQQQRCLQTGTDTHNQAHSALMATELKTLKNSVSVLKRGAEMQMKRMWTDPGKRALETVINDLQIRVEELEQLTPTEDAQRAGRYPQAYDVTKKIEEAVLWARVSLLHLDRKAALFPDDLRSEIESCKVLIGAAEEKKAVVVQLVGEAQRIAPQLESGESSALALLSDQLQTSYKDLVLKLAGRLEQLESQLGKRKQLFADIEKLQAKLKEAGRISRPGASDTSLKSEMDHWHAAVEESAKEIKEAKGILDASPQGLNVFEQLFLHDCLRSLQSRTERAHRLNQINCRAAENKVDAYEKFTRKLVSLEQDLCSLQCEELELDQAGVDQDIKSKLCVLKERAAAIQSSLSHLEKYKEIWECLHLKWGAPGLEKLQGECCKLKRKLEQRVNGSAEGDGHRTALEEVEALICMIQKHCDVLKDGADSVASETSPVSEKTLSWKVQQARQLTEEALRLLGKTEAFGPLLKEAKMQQINSLGVKIDGLAKVIQSKILAAQEKCGHEQGFQSKLCHTLAALKQIKSELQQPILLDLDTQTIRCENMYCTLIEDAVEVESRIAEDLITRRRGSQEGSSSLPDSLQRELDELQSLKEQLKSDIAAHKSALNEAFGTVKSYREAVRRAAELLSQREALFCTPLLSLDELEEPSLLSRQRQEELEHAMSQVETLTSAVGSIIKPQAKPQLEKTLGDLLSKSLIAREQEQKRNFDVQRCSEKYKRFKTSKEMIRVNLNDVERMLQKSLYHIPVSYKQALEQSEQSKMMSSRLVSIEEDLRKLRQDSGQLVLTCSENDCVLIDTVVSTFWLKWLCLLDTAKEWEGNCEEQNQEWKSITEEMERESIILDNLQEELPENPKEKERATKEELEEFLECANIYGENVNAEKLLLRLILHRIRSVLMVPEGPSVEGGGLPVMNEIQAMQNRTEELSQKAQMQKEAVQSEIEERDKVNEEICALKASLHDTESLLHKTDLEPLNEKTVKLEEIQRAIDNQKQILKEIMDKLRIKYSEMYTIVPVEIETRLEDCKQTLQELEEKVTTESLKLSPHYTADKKIQDISKGLQAVENMLQQKSKGTARAKEIQKRIWDMLDLWHYKMNELDSEIQDLVEQDPGQQGQELMDRWMIPLQRYQQISQRAERRTADLNRATSKMEECEELLKSTQVWLENTSRLLTEEVKSDSAKALRKHADALQMAFEDSEQKQSILSAIYPELEGFSSLIETGCTVQMLNKVNEQVKALQQKILEILPHVEHLADEVEAIESEVKKMEKDVNRIRAILSPSEDTLDLSPQEHLKHGQVIMAHISPMQKAIAGIQSYKESLRLPGMRMQPISVFQRTKQLLKELKTLERITMEQNALLEPIVKELEESEQEIDSLKQFQFMRSGLGELAAEIPWPAQAASHAEGEEMEDIKQRIAVLCQRKEDILTKMKDSLAELHQREEQPEVEEDILENLEPEESGAGADWQQKKRGSLSLLPSLVEEAEDSSFHNEAVDAEEPDQQLISLSLQRTGSGKRQVKENMIKVYTLEKGKASPSRVTNTAEGFLGDSEEPVSAGRPDAELAQLLHVWQAQIAELEQWLDQTRESLGSGGQTRQMQQTVEQRLVAWQVILSEIEQKVAHLLEDCKDRHTSESPGLQQEAESLSSKLRDVKCNLERVQVMLQETCAEEQISPEENIFEDPFYFDLSDTFPLVTLDQPLFSRQNGLEQRQELLLQLSGQNNLVDFIDVYMEKRQPQSGDGNTLESQASLMGWSTDEVPTSGNEPVVPKDQAGDKWQHLQQELLFKAKPPHCQLPESQISTKINILPKGATASVRTPTVEELKMYMAQLGNLSQEASVQTQENMTGEASLSLDLKLFELLLAIGRCLNDMEQMLNTYELTSEEAAVQQMLYETLSAELQKLHADIGEKKDDLLRSIASAGGNADRFSQCFSNLQSWLQSTQAAASSRSKSIKAELDQYSQYQNEIRRLYGRLIMKKSLLQESFGPTSEHSIPEQLQKLDAHELEMQNFEMQTAKLRGHVPVALIHDVHKLEDVLDDLWEILQSKQKALTSPFISKQQYEALLQGIAELADLGREKVAQEIKLKATSRTKLQFHLQNHKSFFCNKAHMELVQMCSEKVASSVLKKRGKSWSELVEEDQCLEQQAIQHGAYLERLLQDWVAFDDGYASFCPKLEALCSAVPTVGLVEETEEKLTERTQILQQIKMNMEGEQAAYCQIVKEGKKLTELVSCPELQVQIKKLEEQWASLAKRVSHELQRLETLLKLLSSYNRDSKELDTWLESAQQRIRNWKEQSLNASQDLNTVRNNICNFIAFSAEVDDKSSLKSSVISTGNQLLLLKQSDAAGLRSALATYEQRWADLFAQLPSIQEKLLQLQMAKLPSHEAITELMDRMNQIEQERRAEATANAQSPTSQVKGLLKKYKEYEIEMNFKQGVVDYVNQSLLQMTTCDVKNKRYERTVFAEHLGEMNLQWHRLRGSLSGKIKELEQILESAEEKERRAQFLGNWLEAQSRRLKQTRKPASSILAQDTAQDCKALENQLAVKSKELDLLKQSYKVLGSGAEDPLRAMPRTSSLDEMRTRVASQVALLKTSTESALEQWRIYDEAWDEVRLMLARISYCMAHSTPPVVTFETLKAQVETLQSLQDKAESNEEIWAKLQAASCNLKKLCDPSFSEIIEQKCKEARTRWTLMNKEIEDHLHKAQASLQLWESYIGLHAEVMAKVDKYEEQYDSLLADVPAGRTVGFLKQKVEDVKARFDYVFGDENAVTQCGGLLATNVNSSLPEEVVTAVSLDSFKKGLDKFMEKKGINGYHYGCLRTTSRLEREAGYLPSPFAKGNHKQMLKLDLQNIRESLLPVSELADKIAQLAEPTEPLLPEKLRPLQRISYLEKRLQMKENEFEFELLQLKRFETCLENLGNHVKGATDVLDNLNPDSEDSDLLMSQVLALTALTPKMESLNEFIFRFPLSDCTAERLQNLRWQWTQKKAMALEKCCELQDIQSDEKFIQRCQKWVLFQEKMKEVLREDIAGSLEGLWKQQREYELLQAEILVNQQTFNSVVSKALHVLESGEAENRSVFLSKLTLLMEQWQSIVRAAQQRKGEIDSLVKQWQKLTTSLQDIRKILTQTSGFITAVESQGKYSLHQLGNLSHDIKKREILLQRWQTKYSLTLAAGEKLLEVTKPEARIALQLELRHVQETWGKTQLQLEKIRKQLQRTLQTWESCKSQAEILGNRLRELKAGIKDPLPVQHAELQAAKEHAKELEKSLANWNQNANKLGSMKGLAHYILAEDVMVLKEQVEHLHRQWEELCLRVSLRKQEIEDRLNAWIVFNEKNKELCAWLVQMESKVLQSADVSIEDMIDKLEKDCMDEISLFSENNLVHLKQMGEQLIKASNESKATEIDEKLNKMNDRWKHLFDVIGGRVKKLKETFSFIQLLNKNMSNLRTWLARIESELSKPVVYDTCDDQEIKKRLAEQQDLQRDIDQHNPDVDSVFRICDVLLNDSDACANQTECDSIQQTTRSLDRRWRNICAMSMERRMKIEETWQLWQKFLEDYSRFEDWLKTAEKIAAYPNSSEVTYVNAKEDLKKFEAFQRQIHERLTQLELINKQYRRLARENRTDSASKLKQMVHKGNQDWDNLQKRVTAILRRLKHFTNQWEDFVGTKDSILVWLTEVDLQLTNVEHFSESNFDEKMRQLNCFEQEILLNTDKIKELMMSGKHLIQKSEPSDAVVIEEELQETHRYYQDVFGRVSRFQHRLASWPPGLEDEKETSENEADMEDARGMQRDPWCRKAMQEVLAPQQSLCHLVPPAVGHERSGCETPVSVDSIPLEWDHTGDVGDSGPQDEEEEQYYSDLSDVEIPENAEAYLKMTTKSLKAASEKSASETHTWHSPDSPARRKHPYNQGEMVQSVLLNSPETSTPCKPGYVKQRSSRNMDRLQEISGMLPGEEPQISQSLAGIVPLEKKPGGLERWELIQAQDLSNKLRMKQNRQQREQLNSDLTNINAWLDKTEKELEMLQEAEPPTSIAAIHQRVKKQKDMLKAFDNYKALVLSANLTSKDIKQGDSAGSKELQNRLRQVNMRWEEAIHSMGEWRKSLQEALVGCQDFHKQNHNLLLWLAVAEVRRHQAQIKDLNADPHAVQESRRELMQLEKELLERQPQVNTLQEISTHLLVKSGGGDYVEAHEKVHVIGNKLKQLLEKVSSDLKVSHGKPDTSAFLQDVEELDSGGCPQRPEKPCTYKNKAGGRNPLESESGTDIRGEDRGGASPAAPKTRGFLSRVLRMAFPLQLLFLLLLLLATLPPFSEEDYSCTHRNNFARSFHPMLRFVNGPPPF